MGVFLLSLPSPDCKILFPFAYNWFYQFPKSVSAVTIWRYFFGIDFSDISSWRWSKLWKNLLGILILSSHQNFNRHIVIDVFSDSVKIILCFFLLKISKWSLRFLTKITWRHSNIFCLVYFLNHLTVPNLNFSRHYFAAVPSLFELPSLSMIRIDKAFVTIRVSEVTAIPTLR